MAAMDEDAGSDRTAALVDELQGAVRLSADQELLAARASGDIIGAQSGSCW